MVGRDLGADLAPGGLGVRDRLHRRRAAQVLEMHARGLVHRKLGVARDHRGLADGRYPADAERRADAPPRASQPPCDSVGSSSCRLITPPHNRWYCNALRSVPALDDRPAVVGEPERALLAQLGHLGQLLAFQPARDRREKAHRDARLARGAVAQRSQQRRGVDDRVGVRHRDHRAEPSGRGCPGARLEVLLVLLAGRAQVDVRVDERRQQMPALRLRPSRSPPGHRCSRARRARRCVRRARARHGARRCPRAGPGRARLRSSSSAGVLGPWMSGFAAITPAGARGRAAGRERPRAAHTARPCARPRRPRTCAVMTACGESTTSPESSTPRLTGPGCISTWRGLRRRPLI